MEDYKRAGFIGSGNMAEAMARGFMKAGLFTADKITASDVSEERKNVFAKLGIRTVGENPTVLKEADLIVLAVKPQQMLGILEELQGAFRPGHLVISIAAGITTEILEAYTGESPVIRVMPNTPMLLGAGASAFAGGEKADDKHLAAAQEALETAGMAVKVNEDMMDAVTALSGSGPAYFFYFVEALLKAAGEAGLNRDVAERLLFQTVSGAAEMLAKSGHSPERLREMVTSPGGTTEAALKCFQKHDLAGTISEGFKEAVQQSKRLRQKD